MEIAKIALIPIYIALLSVEGNLYEFNFLNINSMEICSIVVLSFSVVILSSMKEDVEFWDDIIKIAEEKMIESVQ